MSPTDIFSTTRREPSVRYDLNARQGCCEKHQTDYGGSNSNFQSIPATWLYGRTQNSSNIGGGDRITLKVQALAKRQLYTCKYIDESKFQHHPAPPESCWHIPAAIKRASTELTNNQQRNKPALSFKISQFLTMNLLTIILLAFTAIGPLTARALPGSEANEPAKKCTWQVPRRLSTVVLSSDANEGPDRKSVLLARGKHPQRFSHIVYGSILSHLCKDCSILHSLTIAKKSDSSLIAGCTNLSVNSGKGYLHIERCSR
ncbi:hypothetical protein DEU56DRAFT_757926 [Suillus clintonianus]|uniref:uncharacterized protein n=1 Tax=Suillus clintonianus TaxID=1904413 RepID=UPI001B8775E0|nr:uncharacterized protein DEU56DRAFT_757926 [Suillus clintonianus]KAG2130253.1 hypothetical protein DEU56DRAFT_757926 [Suillus clintonianus]